MKDPYEPYYNGSGLGQQSSSKSMDDLSIFFKEKKVKKILDFCCGTGRNSIFLSRKGFDVFGFDRSEIAIQTAIAKQEKDKTNVKFMLFRLKGRLPHEDNFFDAVIAVRALYQARMVDVERYAKEIYRITKTGGYLYIESDQQYTWNRKQSYGQVKTKEKGTYIHEDGDYYHYFTKAEIIRLFRGYSTIRFYFKNRRFQILLQKQD